MTYGQQLHQPGLAAGSSTATPGVTILKPYKLEPPEWRAPLIANKEPPLYPDLFPGATALYPQSSIQLANAHVPGVSRDSSASASSGSHHFIPVAGVTASKEDELTDTVTKLGFVNKAVVQTEHFSAHALIFNKLHNGPSIHALGKIIQRVLDYQQKDETLTPTTGSWTYKPPSRVVYNASRLESWYAELANPSVPLSKLAKTIPSAPSSSTQPVMSTGTGTYTGASSNAASPVTHAKNMGSAMDRNVDMVITRQIPLDRALWFLQAVGQNDIAQLSKSKNLQVHPCTSYSIDYTNALVDALKRQINEALLPLAQFGQTAHTGRLLPGMTVRGRPRNVFAEDQNRERWLARFDYTLALLQASLSETMLDRQHLCELLLENMASSSQVQLLWWLSTLLQTVIDNILEATWMGQKLARIVFYWLLASQKDAAEDTLPQSTCQDIGHGVLRALWLTDYNLFLIPEIWRTGNDNQLQAYIGLDDNTGLDGDRAKWNDLAGRVAMLLCRTSPATYDGHLLVPQDKDHGSSHDSPSILITHREAVQMLDGWSASETVQSLSQRLFSLPAHDDNGSRRQSEAFKDAGQSALADPQSGLVQVLLRWATTTARRGRHRPWLVAAILAERADVPRMAEGSSAFRSSTNESAPESGVSECLSLERVRDATMSWLDAQEVTLTEESSPIWTTQARVLQMCMILLDRGVLEISGLLQKIIARGLQGHQGSNNEPGLYSLILGQYSSSGQTSALHWQRRRVGILESGSSDLQRSKELEAAILALEDHLGQQIRRQEDAHNPGHNLEDAIERLCSVIKDLSTMEKAQVVAKSIMPRMLAILKRHLESPLNDSAVMGMLSLLHNLHAYIAQTQVMCQILNKHIITESALLAMISMRRADKRLYTAIGHESHYATALLNACARLWSKSHPDTRALQELVNLGKRYLLDPAQLRALRNQVQIWQAYSTYRHPPQYLGSPIEADRTDVAFLDELVSFVNTYVANTSEQDCPSEEELAILTSICGGPPSLHLEVLPAMLVWVSRSVKFDHGATRLCALAATVNSNSTTPNNQSPDQGVLRCGLEEISLSFSDSHGDLLVRLVREEAIRLAALVDLVINPILQRVIETLLPPIKTKSALRRLIYKLLTEHANVSCFTWQIEAVRASLFEGSAFFCILRLARQLAVLAGREDSLTQETIRSEGSPWRPLLEELLSSSRYQESFTASIKEVAPQMLNAFASQNDNGMADFELLWQSLNFTVEQWTAPAQGVVDCASDESGRTLLASRLLATGHYTVFTSPLARCYFKALFVRLGPEYSIRLGPTVSSAANATQRHDFARHCLQHMLKSSIKDGDDQIRMFAEQHWHEFIVAIFEKLAQFLVSLADEGGATPIHDDQGRVALSQIHRLVHILMMVTASTSAVSTIKNDALASRIMESLYQARSTRSEGARSFMTTGVILQEIQLFTRIICLAEVWLNAWTATSGALGQIIGWLLNPTHGLAGKANLSFRSDVLAWLLQETDVKTRRHCLGPLQTPLLSVRPMQEDHRPWWQGHVSLGVPTPLTCLAREGVRYIVLQRTWAGLSSSAPEVLFQSGQKPNNEPQDLQKYGSRTLAINRQFLPQFRDVPVEDFMGQTFDSEMPWDRETIFERDFRRASVPQVDLSSASSQSQLTRSRQPTINEVHNVQAKAGSTAQASSAAAAKSANKGKGLGQPVQSNTKKRKNVSDVVIIEDNSPKKKSRTITSSNTGSKQQKKK